MPDVVDMQSRQPPRPTPSSSDTSARLTPNSDDSDSDDDRDVFAQDGVGLLGDNDAYEMTDVDWDGEKRHQGRDGRADEVPGDEGFRVREPRKSGLRKDQYTAEEEQDVVRKFDRRLVIFVALLYMLSFLDRSSACPLLSSEYLLLRKVRVIG